MNEKMLDLVRTSIYFKLELPSFISFLNLKGLRLGFDKFRLYTLNLLITSGLSRFFAISSLKTIDVESLDTFVQIKTSFHALQLICFYYLCS